MPASNKMRRKRCHAPRTSLPRPSSTHYTSMCLLVVSIMLSAAAQPVSAATQLNLLINDDELLMQPAKPVQVEALEPHVEHATADDPAERFNLYRSELKRLSYETIHRILRDENEPIYKRGDAELHYYQKRSYQTAHELVRRAAAIPEVRKVIKEKVLGPESPAENTLKFAHMQLLNFDAGRDYQGKRSAIYTLDLSNNRLQAVNLSAFTALQHVTLANNSLTAIPLHENVGAPNTITTLNLNNNQIKQASAVRSTNLHELYLSGNEIPQLAHLNLSMLSALETLDLSCNRIAELETAFFPQRMHNLKHLNLAYNRIGTIYRATFYNLLSLNTLLLSHNQIRDIDYETFLALPNLQYLDLSYNQLRAEAIRALQGIPDLVRLSIAYNPEVGAAMQEFVASWSLKELDASGTGLCQIPAALAQSVRTLKLTDNWLKIINCGDLDSYPLLQYLDLSHSRIEDIEDDALGRLEILETLFLDHNRLHKVPISLPTSLEYLFLQHNEIMDIQAQSFQGLNNLQTLDLSGNKLLYLPALPLPKLLTLNLRAAGLRGVSQAMVHTLPRLRDLLLDENPIKCSDLLSIAEWASPCRIVERSGDDGGAGANNTEWESLNIEGNSIMGDLGEYQQRQRQQQLSVDNRIGYGEREGGQMMPMSASVVKLGQQQVEVQWSDDEALVDKETADAQLSLHAATNIELKQKFVRMHNFFEKFKSNCGTQSQLAGGRKQTADVARTPTPACAIDMESSSEQAERAEVVTADPNAETSEATYNLPSEKSNAKTATQPSAHRPDMYEENMSSEAAQNKTGVERREMTKTAVGGMKKAAEAKLYKFNQKNFTAEMVESSEATTTITTTTTLAKFAEEATFDYKLDATHSQAKVITRINEKVKAARSTGQVAATKTQTPRQTQTQTETQTTASAEKLKSTTMAMPTNAPPVVAQTLWQFATVAAGSGAATAANLLKQQITPTITTKTPGTKYTSAEYAKSIAATTKRPTTKTSTQADTPQTMLVNSMLLERIATARTATPTAAISISKRQQRQQQAQTTTSLINAKLAAKSSLNTARDISEYQLEQQQQQQRSDDAQVTSQGIETTTAPIAAVIATTNADAANLLQIIKYEAGAQNAGTAGTIQQLPRTIPSAYIADSNNYMPATIGAQATANTTILPIAATFLQMKRVQPNAEMAARTTNATFNVAATMLISNGTTSWEQMAASAEQAGQSGMSQGEAEVLKAAGVAAKVIIMPTTKTIATKGRQTTQLSQATIQTESMAKQRVDNNLTRNDSDNDGYKVQSNNQQPAVEGEDEERRVAAVATPKQLAKPKPTQFWQQHNFKRANPYPNDISGQRRQNGKMQDESNTEHTVDTTRAAVIQIATTTRAAVIQIATTTHAPPHMHEPLQLHIRDRHLIGTPLLMHRGQNMLVEATEALRQAAVTATTSPNAATTGTSKTANDMLVQQRAMNDKALAKGQPTEAGHKANSHSFKGMVPQSNVQWITNTTSSNNFSDTNSVRSQAEAINVETNVTPEHTVGGDVQQRPVQQTDRQADKQTLAGKVVATKTTVTVVKTTAATATTVDNINMAQHKATASAVHREYDLEHRVLQMKHDDIAGGGGVGGRRKPTLIMKKMTIQTKHAEHQIQTPQQHPQLQSHYTLNTPRENESVLRERSSAAATGGTQTFAGKRLNAEGGLFANSIAHDERAELMHNMPQHKHSTVNTPIIRDSREDLLAALDSVQFDEQAAQEKPDAPTSQHSISNQRQVHTHAQEHAPLLGQERFASHMHTQKWLDVRKVGPGSAHPGVVILLSFSLLAVLLVGLMHVYRCDVLPWRRHFLAHQQRPHHQRQFNVAADDDAHSFLHYHNNGGGEQPQRTQQPPRWHHGARTRAPYSSPLHNLHVRELQKTSAVELEAAARVTRSYYDVRPYAKTASAVRRNGSTGSSASGASGEVSRNSNSSLNSTHSSTTAGILEADDAFYVEMAAECGQMTGCGGAHEALHCDMLPMELLTAASTRQQRTHEKEADAAVHETVSLRLGDAERKEADVGTVIGAEGGKQTQNARGNNGGGAPTASGCRSKMRSNATTYAAPSSSSTRKFDLW